MKKAELIYLGDKILVIPKEGNASMLFLEWVADMNFKPCPIKEIRNGDIIVNGNEVLYESAISVIFDSNWNNIYDSAIKYINDNL